MLRIITLFFALSLILALSYPVVDAHSDTPLARRHAPALNRMMKKRASLIDNINNAAGAGSAQQAPNDVAQQPSAASPSPIDPAKTTDTAATGNNQPSVTPKTSAAPVVVVTQTLSTPQATSATPSAVIPIVATILGNGSPVNTSVSNTQSVSSSSSSSSSVPPTSSSSSATPSLTQSSTPAPNSLVQTGVNAITVTTSTPPPSASPTGAPTSNGVTKIQRNTIIILVAIGGSIGAAGIIWTIIRKWKLGPSSSFEDRMQPIDWQPTAAPHEEHDITEKLTRNGSVRSHGSFTSGNNHDTLPVDLPPHDFTAGPAHLAPVGGYADLQRGPSPQPDMQHPQNFRAPSPYEFEMPNPHGQYYNGAGAGAGAGYQGGYDYNRGY